MLLLGSERNGYAHRGYTLLMGISVALAAGLMGCEKPSRFVPVHGTVSYRGSPLEFGSIMFQPEGQGEVARATIEPDGTFVLTTKQSGDGVLPGRCRVRVACMQGHRSGAAPVAGGAEPTMGQSLIPKQYGNFGTSGIEIDVTPGMPLPITIDLQ